MSQAPPDPRTPDSSIPEPDPLDALIRRERKARRLPPNAVCTVCGESDPRLLEVHHIAGAANDPKSTVTLCLNHHRQQSADQRAVGVDLDSRVKRTVLECVVAWLRGLGLLFAALAESCRRMAEHLATLCEALDADYPEWRKLPEAEE